MLNGCLINDANVKICAIIAKKNKKFVLTLIYYEQGTILKDLILCI